MYRVLLADDEPWILEGIQASLDWEELGFCIADTATNGLEAAEKIRKLRPDFVLADIRMPGLDGIGLLSMMRKEQPELRFAIFSGHSDFAYAQQCIALGVSGYLLKPLDEEELTGLLNKIRAELDERQAGRDTRLFLEDIEESTGMLARRFPEGCMLALQVGGTLGDIALPSLRTRLGPGRFLHASKEFPVTEQTLPLSVAGLGIMRYAPETELSTAVIRLEKLAYGFFVTPQRRLYAAWLEQGNRPGVSNFRAALAAGDDQKIRAALDAIRAEISSYSAEDMLNIWHIAQYLGAEGEIEEIYGYETLFSRFRHALDMLDSLSVSLFQSSSPQTSANGSVAAYINAHYKEDISLLDLSEALHMSPSTLRKRLRQETCENFVQALTRRRLQAAVKLLTESELLVNDIALRCGFQDPLYFRKVFRKTYLMTPLEYRKTYRQRMG